MEIVKYTGKNTKIDTFGAPPLYHTDFLQAFKNKKKRV